MALGQNDLATTMSYYSHLEPDDLPELAELLPSGRTCAARAGGGSAGEPLAGPSPARREGQARLASGRQGLQGLQHAAS